MTGAVCSQRGGQGSAVRQAISVNLQYCEVPYTPQRQLTPFKHDKLDLSANWAMNSVPAFAEAGTCYQV